MRCEPDLLRTLIGSVVLNALWLDTGGKVSVSFRRRRAWCMMEASYTGTSIAEHTGTFIELPHRADPVSVQLGLGFHLMQQLCYWLDLTICHERLPDGGQRLVLGIPAAIG